MPRRHFWQKKRRRRSKRRKRALLKCKLWIVGWKIFRSFKIFICIGVGAQELPVYVESMRARLKGKKRPSARNLRLQQRKGRPKWLNPFRLCFRNICKSYIFCKINRLTATYVLLHERFNYVLLALSSFFTASRRDYNNSDISFLFFCQKSRVRLMQ